MPRFDVPSSLDWLWSCDEGRAWLSSLPELVRACCSRWSLTPGPPYEGAYCSYVVPVRDTSGLEAVLKLQFPDHESEHEAAALALWSGEGAVRLLDQDKDARALLIERCIPGDHLSALPADEALEVLIALVPRLSVAADEPFTRLEDEAARWATNLPRTWEAAGQPFEVSLLDVALELLATLPATQGQRVLLHQDLHADNVVRAERERWLVIDPKPLVGELAFALAPIIRSGELGDSERDVVSRLDRLSEALGVDRERARGWAIAQTMAWSFEGTTPIEGHVDVARWLARA